MASKLKCIFPILAPCRGLNGIAGKQSEIKIAQLHHCSFCLQRFPIKIKHARRGRIFFNLLSARAIGGAARETNTGNKNARKSLIDVIKFIKFMIV